MNMNQSGVYLIKSTIDDRKYVGSAKVLRLRLKSHKWELANNRHYNRKLQNFYNKYGDGSLDYTVLELCAESQLIEREQHYIDTLSPEFNILRKAYSPLGHKHTQEAIEKMRKAQKGKNLGRPSPMKGKHHTAETRKILSELAKSRKLSPEHRKNIGLGLLGRRCPTAGKPLSDEHKGKLAVASSKQRHTKETRDKISKGNKGKVRSEQWRKRLSESRKGIVFDEPWRKKLGERSRETWRDPERRRKHSEFMKAYQEEKRQTRPDRLEQHRCESVMFGGED